MVSGESIWATLVVIYMYIGPVFFKTRTVYYLSVINFINKQLNTTSYVNNCKKRYNFAKFMVAILHFQQGKSIDEFSHHQ